MNFRLTKAQVQIYNMEKIMGGSVCNITGSSLCEGKYDVELMKKSIFYLYKHNDALRLQICDGKVPTQKVSDITEDMIESYSFSTKEEFEEWANNLAKKPIGMQGRLCYLSAINIDDKYGGVLIHLNHLISDAWTNSLIIKHFFAYYEQLKSGNEPKKEQYSYLEYIDVEEDYINTNQYKQDMEYWAKQYNEQALGKLSNKVAQSYAATRLAFDEKQSKEIITLCKEKNLSVFNAYMTALGMYIARQNRGDNCCIGTALLNRSSKIEKNTMGMFVNTVGICGKFEEKTSFYENAKNMKYTLYGAMRHQKCNYVDVASEKLGNHFGNMYDTYVNYQNVKMDGNDVKWYFCGMQNTNLAISISDWAGEDRLHFDYDYRNEVFTEEEVYAIHRHIIQLLINGLKSDIPWNELSALPDWEKDDILNRWNNTEYELTGNLTIKSKFEEQVKKNTNKLALVFGEQKLTYGEFNARCNQIAHMLRSKGVSADDFVCIVAERSCEMIEAVFGCLKAGGAYVPISKSYPNERIEYIINDCSPKVVLTYNADCTFSCNVPVIELNNENLAGYSTDDLEIEVGETDLAYAIYTSGTTGRPKGVMIENKSVVSFCANCEQNHFQKRLIENCDYVLAASNIAFDIHLQEIELPLLNGKTVLLVNDESKYGFAMTEKVLESYEKIAIITTPTLLKARLESSIIRKNFKNVSLVMVGAESFPPELFDRIKSCSNAIVINGYGPTETTCGILYDEITDSKNVTIGTPIANAKAYVMHHGTLCGYGMTGELYLAGNGVARGYINMEKQTKEVFVDNAFGYGKMYKTGDLVKLGCDGKIEFCGRIDEQVKIRGFRIELEEIRRNLLLCDGVKSGFVDVRVSETNTPYLAAFFTAEQKLDLDIIRIQLGKILPDYMVPSCFMQLDELPVNSSGKIDKKQLPKTSYQEVHNYVEPKTELQKIVAQAFCEVLHLEKAGLEDNFFEAGGDSIKAISVATYLREHNVEVQVFDIIQNKTVRLIAMALENVSHHMFSQEPVVGKVEMTPLQMDFFNWNLEKPEHFNQSVLLEVKEELDINSLNKSLRKLLEHHDMLRAVVNQNQLIIRPVEAINDFEIKQYTASDEELETVIGCTGSKIQSSFKLENNLLFEVCVFKSECRTFLFIVAHHLIVDGISWRIILSDLESLYKNIAISDKEMTFTMWADKLKEYSQMEFMAQDIAYWKYVVKNISNSACNDKTADNKYSYSCKRISIPVSADKMEHFSQITGLYMEEQILWKSLQAMKNWLNKESFSVMMENNGRAYLTKDVQLEHTVGWFTNTYPVFIDVKSSEDSFNAVKETLRSVRYNGIGYGIAKNILNYNDLQCQADLAFNYLGNRNDIVDKDSIFAVSDIFCGEMVAKENKKLAPMVLDCSFINGQLVVDVNYNEYVYNAESIDKFGEILSTEMCMTDGEQFADICSKMLRTDLYQGYIPVNDFEKICSLYKAEEIQKITDLTKMQEAMVYYKMLDSSSRAYFIQNGMSVTGDFIPDIAVKSIKLLAYKHPLLRSRIVYQGLDKPYCVQLKDADLEVSLFENANAEDIIQKDFDRGFDLEKDSLLRVTIVSENNEQSNTSVNSYKLVWSFHHSIIDGWCVDILYSDFITNYKKLVSGTADFEELTKLMKNEQSRPYSDYIEYRKLLNNQQGLNYWKELLEDCDESAELQPFEKVTSDKEVETNTHICSAQLTEQLKKLARENQVTQNTVLETAWGMFLMRYSGLKDVVFGKTVSGRDAQLDKIESMVGLFINTIPVRVVADKDMKVRDLLNSMQEQAEESSKYDYCSLVDIQKVAGISKDFIKSLFVFENYEFNKEVDQQLEGISITIEEAREQLDYDLSLAVSGNEYWKLQLLYNPSVYSKEQATLYMSGLCQILEGMLEPQDNVSKVIHRLTTEEKDKILNDFNTKPDKPSCNTVVEILKKQFVLHPDKIAVQDENRSISYKELENEANKVATVLCSKGIGRNDIVAVVAERNVEAIVLITGILLAGAAFLPIDPAFPKERIVYMLGDCKPVMILNASKVAEFKEYGIDELHINDLLADMPKDSLDKVEAKIQPNDLSYVIYTSGTTGNPKGVLIEHLGVANLAEYFINDLEIQSGMNVLQYHNFIFDGAVWEIIMGLCTGGTLFIIPKEIMADAYEVRNYIINNHIQIAALPPQLYLQQEEYPLDTIITAGSQAVKEVVQKACLARRYINSYGPTEGTVSATHWIYQKGMEIPDRVPIGKPIANKTIYILNGMEFCGIGMLGELCIGGCGLARGYLNLEELTTDRFIDNPYGEGKLYRTGDLARWLPDGNIEYLGRIDEQIKVRGFRVELSEVENVIRKQDHILDVTVVARKDENAENYLVAYVVSSLQNIDTAVLLDELRKELPDYMIPAGVMQIDSIPMTRNGKVDKRALPVITFTTQNVYVAPANKLEERLVDVFEKILSVNHIGTTDNFFELGGHSLKAARLTNEIEAAFNVRIPLKTIFEKPTVSLLAEILTESTKESAVEIPQADTKEYYKMSSTQKRVYFVCDMDDSKIAYNMPMGIRLKGDVDCKAIEKAFQGLVERHEALRTSFHVIDGEYLQKVHNPEDVTVSFEYLERMDCPDIEMDIFKEFVRPFNFEYAPLIRMLLLKTAHQEYSLFIDMHHIISDGASMKVLLSDFIELYNGNTLEKIDRQYKDYSEWMDERDWSTQKSYWKDVFCDEVPLLELPLDFPRPPHQSFSGNKFILNSDKDFVNKIKAFGKVQKTTDYMILLSSFMVLLSKYSRQNDIVVGTTVSGRTNKSTESILGMFANTLAMRGQPEGNKNFRDFLSEMKEICFRAYENQEYPFEKLLEDIDIPKMPNRNPLFDVMFVMQNNELPKINLQGVSEAEGFMLEDDTAKFDLTVSIQEFDKGYEFVFEYCSDIFAKESIVTLAEHYINLTNDLITNAEIQMEKLSGVSESELNLVINDFNDSYTDYAREKTIVQLFDEQAESKPDALAVEFGDSSYTYSQLKERAEQFASRILEEQVNVDDCVVVLGERSKEAIAAIIGILKAGCAYVPIDVSYPEERIRYIIKDCKPKLILCDDEFMGIDDTIPCVSLKMADLPYAKGTVSANIDSRSLAYIIYTSGTTGKPKGTLVEHRSVVRLVNNNSFVELSENSVIFQTGAIAFDASTFEIWGALLNGGRLILAGKDDITNPAQMKRIIEEKQVNTMWLTSTLFNQMVDTNVNIFESLTYLLVGGEKLSDKHIKKFYENVNTVQLINGYGPTENTTFTATYPIPKNFAKIPIGKPISNTQVYILNKDTVCGIGMPGELCTTGDGVARGYLNRDELTNEKFVDNPFGSGKMYRTGDLARWNHDGNIEYLGRIDEQIKIRGFRIELEEIENTIKANSAIDDAAVVVRTDSNAEKYIVAFFSSAQEINVDLLKDNLRKSLPDYMIPVGFKQLDKLPVNQNGKIDKSKLPDVEIVGSASSREPQTELERIAVQAFCKILNINKLGVDDNFFELGGHSLKAATLINELESLTGIRIPLKEIYYRATPALVAEYLEEHPVKTYERILPVEQKDCYLMSATQKRLFIIDQIDDMGVAYNMPSKIKFNGILDVNKVQMVFDGLLARHEILRTSFCEKDGELLQYINENVDIKVEYEEINDADENKITSHFREFVKPFDLGQAPLMRCKVIKISDKESMLFFDMHHIVGDGHSMSVIMNEFNALYNGEKLQEQTVQYKDYSEWMRKRDLTNQRDYWIEQLEGDIEAVDLPLDYKRPQYQTFNGDSIFFTAEKELQDLVKNFADFTGASEYMVLLSAFMVLLGKYDEKEDFIVGSPVSGRTHKDMENMLGMFVNTLPMRGKPCKNKRFIDFLAEMKDMCVKAYENQEYPFEELVEELDIPRDVSRNPLFDLMFVFQNGEQAVAKLDGVEDAGGFSSEDFAAKFDITVNINLSDSGYNVMFEYNTDLFKRDSIEYFALHYIQLIKEIIKNPTKQIKEYTGLSNREEQCLIAEFNKTSYDYAESLTVPELIKEQVKLYPNNLAVYYEDKSLSYKEFYQKALSVAEVLIKSGVQRNDFVALIAERSLEMAIGIYGIILAGAAFVPIDPEHPTDRINFILTDCNAKLVLVTKNVKCDNPSGTTLVIEDICNCTPELEHAENINTPNDLLYMIYTSGTTGKPKGVMIEHHGIVNMSMYFKETIGVTEKDRVLQLHNYIFDGAVWEIMMALTTGACLYIVPKDICADPVGIEEYIKTNNITIAALPPQVYMQQGDYPIEKLITAGSEASFELVKKAENNAEVYINSYGPTECTVCATHWEHRKGNELSVRIPIGKPMLNKQIYIMRENRMCGIGMPGELCVAGKGLARGYFKQEQLTADKFTENPFGEGRLYHTGDLARWLPDGTIEYLGRIDQQVKVRGFRVELLEIETILRKLPVVTDAAVIARKDEDGENYIVAYVTGNGEDKLDLNEIKKTISNELPVYMVPSAIMELDSIPMTTSGKVDTKKLPVIECITKGEFVEPRNSAEKKIAKIFEDVLNIEKVGAMDNFFELGGHSLKATKVVNELEKLTGKRLALKQLFENPTVELLALVAFSSDENVFEGIKKVEQKEFYPMSSVQRRLFLIHKMTDINTAYNTPAAVLIDGILDVSKVQKAFQELVNRHEILRTKFDVIEQQYVQIIAPELPVQTEYEKTNELTKSQMQEKYEEFVRPFDLQTTPLIRIKLVEMEQHSLFMIDMHHIISDGQSIQIILKEFAQLYQGEQLEENALQYKDYSEWINSRNMDNQEEYWLKQFEDVPEPLDLGTDWQRPQTQDYAGAFISMRIENDIRERIIKFSESKGVTEYITLVSMIMLLLSKYTKQDDITVGSPFSGRTHYDVQNMLGMFVNTLVLRGNTDPEKSFDTYIEEISEMCMQAFENQDYPYEKLVEAVAVQRDLARNPLFDVMFTYQNNEQMQSADGIWNSAEIITPKSTKAKFDINITVVPDEYGYEVVFEYASVLFKEETINRMANHLKNLVSGITDFTQCKLKEINLISSEEEKQVRDIFNRTSVEYNKNATVISLWKEQVNAHKDEIAVIAKDGSYTYEEVDEASNVLANALIKRGICKNDIVTILHSRAKNMLVAMLGILKSGAGYIPVDPTLPTERIQYMIDDSQSKYIITDDVDMLNGDQKVLLIDDIINGNDRDITEIDMSVSDGISYVIYTSGSTGKPKGTILSNRNLMNFCSNNTEIVQAIKDSGYPKMVSTTTVSFDIFVTESLLCLTNGITVVMADEEEQNNQKLLAQLVEREGPIAMQTTPSKMKAFMYDKDNLDYLSKMTVIILGGEAFPDSLYQSMIKYTNADIFNIYGPSEATVWITTKKIENEKVTIGKPFSNTQIYILENDSLCAIGIPGELCIAGDSVGLGYLNRDDLTKEKFVDNPFGTGKMYHTGDLAKWLPDGNIAYIGRMDDQVKIHGLRIELKEIESCILNLNGIDNAAVIVKEENGDKWLCAYYVSKVDISINDIKTELRKVLPEYMVPNHIMRLDAIPMNKNGKLDRKALPEIQGVSKREIVMPSNEMESIVVEIFADILQTKDVSVYDSFFELGGNSLSVATLINKIEQKTGIRVPFKQIFTQATPSGIAKLLQSVEKEVVEDGYIPLADKKEKYPMSPAQRRIFVIQNIDSPGTAYNMPTAMEIQGPFDVDCVDNAFRKLIEKHEPLRTSFHQYGDEFVQVIHNDVPSVLEYVDYVGQEVDTKSLLKNFVKPFDLSQAPLLRAKVAKLEEDRYLLMFDMHHIISDGGSISILVDDFCNAYKGKALTELKLQYKDYSEWLNSKDMNEQKNYWINQFSDNVPVLDLPYDYPRAQSQNYQGSAVSAKTSRNMAQKVEQLAKETGTTEYMILLSVFKMLLAKYSREDDIVVGTPVSGRTHADTEKMIGMFVNTLAMRSFPESDKEYYKYLDEIKDMCLMAYQNQEYPFEELVDNINIERDWSRNPLFDVMFVLQNNKESALKLSDNTEIKELEPDYSVSKFDITANVKRKANEYVLVFEYCTALFKQESMEGFINHYLNLLEAVVNNPNKKLSEYSELGIDERERIEAFNDTFHYAEEGITVLELFEEQVRKTPDNIAVEYQNESITYREFNEKVNQLAYQLRDMGVGPDEFVCIIAKRSIEMMIGIFAIIKAGGAYVPIDENYPEERISYIIKDCKTKAVLLAKTELSIDVDVPVIDLTDKSIYIGNTENPCIINKPTDLIYLIYTSGTTGQPKGVMNTREGCTNYMQYRQAEHPLDEHDRVLQKTTYTFDVSVWEIIWWSTTGARVVMLEQGDEKDVEAICNEINRKKITVMHFVPSMLQAFVSHLKLNSNDCYKIESLEAVYASGEALKPDTVKLFHEVAPSSTALINLYGPTEASIDVTRFDCDKDYEKILIGKPIHNIKIYILDGTNLCGIGVPGELGIVGKGLARGYLNREDLTEEKFIKNPFGEGRLYRTGDLARLLPDGNIEYLGRIDEQVKIRGFRIELGEIENVIRKQENVQDVAVIAREDSNGEKFIAAYVVRYNPDVVDFEDLKTAIRSTLPDYMVPAVFVQIDSIPVTKNGKLDRRALPEVERVSDREYAEPRTPEEKLLADVLSEILGVKQVGLYDDFYELGGDSIKAIRVVSKLRELGYKLDVKEIMQERTLEGMSSYLRYAEDNSYEQGEITGDILITPIVQEFKDWNLSKPEHFNQCIMLKKENGFDHVALNNALEAIWKHHDMLRSVFQDGKLSVKSSDELKCELTVYDYTEQSVEQARAFVRAQCDIIQSSFELDRGPLMKVSLYQVNGEEHLFICLHHLVVDGVSWRIILEDLLSAYKQYEINKVIELPKKTASYQMWAESINEFANKELIREEIPYWNKVKEQTIDNKPRMSEKKQYCSNQILFTQEQTSKLLYEAVMAYNTDVKELLMTGLSRTMKEVFNKDKIVVMMEGHGREQLHKEVLIDRTVGWFTSVYTVVAEYRDSYEEHIVDTKEVLRKVPKSGFGLGLLKHLTGFEFNVDGDVTFNYLGDFGEGISEDSDILISDYDFGKSSATENKQMTDFIVNASIASGMLQIDVTYNTFEYSDFEIREFAERFEKEVMCICNHCCEKDETSVTASDIGAGDMDEDELSALLDLL